MEIDKARALSPEDLSWLKRLNVSIWEIHESEARANLSGHISYGTFSTEKRQLTDEEFKRLKKLIRKHELPCLPGSGTFGFGFSLTVYNHSPDCRIKPEPVIMITGKHLRQIKPGAKHWGKIWATFEPFTHSPRNREILMWYGLPQPLSRKELEY